MIPQDIQEWIDRDSDYLIGASKKQFDKYVSWFTNSATDHEPNHYTIISELISELTGTKE